MPSARHSSATPTRRCNWSASSYPVPPARPLGSAAPSGVGSGAASPVCREVGPPRAPPEATRISRQRAPRFGSAPTASGSEVPPMVPLAAPAPAAPRVARSSDRVQLRHSVWVLPHPQWMVRRPPRASPAARPPAMLAALPGPSGCPPWPSRRRPPRTQATPTAPCPRAPGRRSWRALRGPWPYSAAPRVGDGCSGMRSMLSYIHRC
mmetsp:Transcript_12986/g.41927  ORF Transcript_12986/g.41927 Transcript_12986/m.41927 type:complete len:207 (-) Transcript_12986:131-751(-)